MRESLDVDAAHDGSSGADERSFGDFSFGEECGLVQAEQDHDVHVGDVAAGDERHTVMLGQGGGAVVAGNAEAQGENNDA